MSPTLFQMLNRPTIGGEKHSLLRDASCLVANIDCCLILHTAQSSNYVHNVGESWLEC